jgi:hypothetical protein
MPTLNELPLELLVQIAGHLYDIKDVVRLRKVNKRVYRVTTNFFVRMIQSIPWTVAERSLDVLNSITSDAATAEKSRATRLSSHYVKPHFYPPVWLETHLNPGLGQEDRAAAALGAHDIFEACLASVRSLLRLVWLAPILNSTPDAVTDVRVPRSDFRNLPNYLPVHLMPSLDPDTPISRGLAASFAKLTTLSLMVEDVDVPGHPAVGTHPAHRPGADSYDFLPAPTRLAQRLRRLTLEFECDGDKATTSQHQVARMADDFGHRRI